MAEIPDMKVKLRKFNPQVTFTVKIMVTRELVFRMWLAKTLIKLAGWVLNCNIVFTKEGSNDAGL